MRLKIFFILSFLLLYIFKNEIYPYLTNVSGTIEIKPEYLSDIKPNSMLYITLHNEKGILFAVKQIINPKFPLKFKITHKNVLYPKLTTSKCIIKAVLNYHGNIYEIKNGDIYSDKLPVFIINPGTKLYLNHKKNN